MHETLQEAFTYAHVTSSLACVLQATATVQNEALVAAICWSPAWVQLASAHHSRNMAVHTCVQRRPDRCVKIGFILDGILHRLVRTKDKLAEYFAICLTMSGVEVIGAISAVFGILDASVKIYNSAQKDSKF
jgi:hypothetical protein